MFPSRLVVATVAIVSLASATQNASADTTGKRQLAVEREAVRIVEDIEEIGREVQFHAERLNTLAGQAGISSWSHYHHLDMVRDLVNGSLQPALRRLSTIQQQQPAWKQESIDQLITAAQLLAADASSAYAKKGKNPSALPVLNEGYRQFIADVAAHATTLVKTADAAHGYAVARIKATEAGLPVAAK